MFTSVELIHIGSAYSPVYVELARDVSSCARFRTPELRGRTLPLLTYLASSKIVGRPIGFSDDIL
jgi:hypothetical protein